MDKLRKWGGWSLGEKLGTIARYLLDETLRSEESVEDLLNPDHKDTDVSMLDENVINFNQFRNETTVRLGELNGKIDQIALNMGTIVTQAVGQAVAQLLASMNQGQPIASTSFASVPAQPSAIIPTFTPVNTATNVISYVTPTTMSAPATSRIPRIQGWRSAVDQWNIGFYGSKPMKNYTEAERNPKIPGKAAFQTMYSQRKKVGEEYNRLTNNGADEEPFLQLYGHCKGFKEMLGAIIEREKQQQRQNN